MNSSSEKDSSPQKQLSTIDNRSCTKPVTRVSMYYNNFFLNGTTCLFTPMKFPYSNLVSTSIWFLLSGAPINFPSRNLVSLSLQGAFLKLVTMF